MKKVTLNRSDNLKILAKTIPLGIMYSFSWMMFVKWFYKIEFVYIRIRNVDILFQVIILLLMSILPTIIGNLLYTFEIIDQNRNRPMLDVFFSRSLYSLSIIVIILFFQSRIIDGFSMIGLNLLSKFQTFDNLATSLLAFLLLSVALGLFQKLKSKGVGDNKEQVFKREDLTLFYDHFPRILALLMLGLQVLSEELLFRGYLVIFLGEITKFPAGLGFISVIITTIGHLYQGREKIIYHFLISIILVSIVLLTRALFISITFHLLINYSYAFSVWRKMEKG